MIRKSTVIPPGTKVLKLKSKRAFRPANMNEGTVQFNDAPSIHVVSKKTMEHSEHFDMDNRRVLPSITDPHILGD